MKSVWDPMTDQHSLVPYNGVGDDGDKWSSGFCWHGTDLESIEIMDR